MLPVDELQIESLPRGSSIIPPSPSGVMRGKPRTAGNKPCSYRGRRECRQAATGPTAEDGLDHVQKLRASRQRRGFDTGFAIEGGHGVVTIDPLPQLLRHVAGGRVP